MPQSSADQLALAYADHYEELVSHVFRKVRCHATAADIVQEAFVRISSRELSSKIDNPRAFLYRVTGNLALDHLRSQDTRSRYFTEAPSELETADTTPSQETALADKQRIAYLVSIVNDLPPRCREVFVLSKFQNLSQGEIAERLGIGRNMVNRHLRHALVICAERLDEEWGEEEPPDSS